MSTVQLERLAGKYSIGGYGDHHGNVDRDIIINALLRRDKAMQAKSAPAHHVANYGTMIGSSIQQGSPGASAIVTYSVEDQREFIQRVRETIPELSLSTEQMRTIETDLRTVELQLSLDRPRKVILNECWSSVRNILEGVAGSLVATGLLNGLAKLLQ